MKNKEVVFDSWPVLALLINEPEAKRVIEILERCISRKTAIWIHPANLGEVWYGMAKRSSAKTADFYVDKLSALGIQMAEPDWNCYRKAAEFKMRGGISYADCMAAALAFTKSATLVTGDFEFKKVEDEVEILWLR